MIYKKSLLALSNIKQTMHFIRLLAFVTAYLLSVRPTQAQSFTWAKGEGGLGNDVANAITTDNNGYTYITGNIAGSANFSGNDYSGRGLYDVFITKYDQLGNVVWVKTAGGAGNDQANAIKYNNGFLYVAGLFNDTAWFESTMLISRGQSDIFLAKYNADGQLIWVKQAGGSGADQATCVDLDSNNDIYIAGNFEYAIAIDTFHFNTTNLYKESFVASYSNSGNIKWAKASIGTGANLITGITFDNHDAVYITGYFSNSFHLSGMNISSNTPSQDIILGKMSLNGNMIWLKKAGGAFEDKAYAICSDPQGNITITGYFSGTAFFDSNSITYNDYNDVYTAHYDSSGNNVWVKAGKGQQLDMGFALTANADGDIFVTGMFQQTIVFDNNTLNGYDRDIFVICYDKNGNIKWLNKAGGPDTECGLAISLSHQGNLQLAGYYLYDCFFGNIQIEHAQYIDLFVASLAPPAPNTIDQINNDDEVLVYPNPATLGELLFLPDNTIALSLFDLTGKLVLNETFVQQKSIELKNVCAGIYILLIKKENSQHYLKVTIQ